MSLRDQSIQQRQIKDVDVAACPLNNRTEGQQTISHDRTCVTSKPSLL